LRCVVSLAEAADRLAGTYSGGMVRRLELAHALVSAPRLLVLDEPTIGLDPIARTSVWERITELREATGMTVLVTTHYMDEADQYCDHVALMHRGQIRAIGTPEELKDELASARGDDPQTPPPSLEDVFRHFVGSGIDESHDDQIERFRDVSAPAVPHPASADSPSPPPLPSPGHELLLTPPRPRTGARVWLARVGAMCIVELQKLRGLPSCTAACAARTGKSRGRGARPGEDSASSSVSR
jgi:hypothetical protein